MSHELISFPGPNELARAAAGAWLDEIESANRENRSHCVALSGGRITQTFFAETTAQATARKTAFTGVHFFWADERCVPPDDPESNFKLAQDLLFTPLNISENQIHRLRGEMPPAEAVALAESELRRQTTSQKNGQPVLDLILLGMGEDGHVASLFPTAPDQIWDEAVPFLHITDSPKPPPNRISLSFAAIIAAKKIWLLASGAGKEKALRESLKSSDKTPLARVIHHHPVKIFTDIPSL